MHWIISCVYLQHVCVYGCVLCMNSVFLYVCVCCMFEKNTQPWQRWSFWHTFCLEAIKLLKDAKNHLDGNKKQHLIQKHNCYTHYIITHTHIFQRLFMCVQVQRSSVVSSLIYTLQVFKEMTDVRRTELTDSVNLQIKCYQVDWAGGKIQNYTECTEPWQ